MDSACSTKFTVLVRFHGEERATELPLTTPMIGRMALEAGARDLGISELAGELVIAVVNQGLFQRVLEE
jgi:hypothetical protein